jgi:hypothetical protein
MARQYTIVKKELSKHCNNIDHKKLKTLSKKCQFWIILLSVLLKLRCGIVVCHILRVVHWFKFWKC